jgi:hypothetical protein
MHRGGDDPAEDDEDEDRRDRVADVLTHCIAPGERSGEIRMHVPDVA